MVVIPRTEDSILPDSPEFVEESDEGHEHTVDPVFIPELDVVF